MGAIVKQTTMSGVLREHRRRIRILEGKVGGGDLTWTNLSLSNGWTAGSVAPAIARDSNGICHLRGLIKPGLVDNVVSTLPFKPSTYQVQLIGGFDAEPVMIEIDDSTGELLLYVNDLDESGWGVIQLLEDGSNYDTPGGNNIPAGTALLDTDGYGFAKWGGPLNSRFQISNQAAVLNPRRLIGLPSDGWGMSAHFGFNGAFAVEIFDGPWKSCMAQIEIVDAAKLDVVTVSAHVQEPFIAGLVMPLGVHFAVDPAGTYELIFQALGTPGGLASPQVVDSGACPALANGDLVTIVGTGSGHYAGWINSTLVTTWHATRYTHGHVAFGIDSSGPFNTTLVTNFAYGYPDVTYWPPGMTWSLDGVSFEGA